MHPAFFRISIFEVCVHLKGCQLLTDQGLEILSIMPNACLQEKEMAYKLFLPWWLVFKQLHNHVEVIITHPDKVVTGVGSFPRIRQEAVQTSHDYPFFLSGDDSPCWNIGEGDRFLNPRDELYLLCLLPITLNLS